MTPANTTKKPYHIAIVGGGIGGLCMAIGLLHQNVSCTLYESAPEFAEIGAGVSFGPNALRAMSLLDPEIEAGYNRIATANAWPSKKTTWFDFRLGMKENSWKKFKCPGEEDQKIATVIAGTVGQSSVHRAHFLNELVRLIPVGIAKFGKRVEKIEKEGEKMQLTFRDGTTAEADAIIGCDGVKSRTRQILLGEDNESTNPAFTGKYAYRGLVPMEQAVTAVGEEFARNCQMYLGEHGHVLTFPIEKGKTMNVVAFRTKENGKWEDERWVLPMKKEDLFNDFAGWGESVHKLLSLMQKPDVWALFDHPPASTYYRGNLVLLGDAAHASTPHQGAGAGQAIEDAFILSHLLGQVDSASGIEKAFRGYDAVRRPRSQKVIATSRDAVAIYEFENEKCSKDLEEMRRTLESRYDWIWEEDLEKQLAIARDAMG